MIPRIATGMALTSLTSLQLRRNALLALYVSQETGKPKPKPRDAFASIRRYRQEKRCGVMVRVKEYRLEGVDIKPVTSSLLVGRPRSYDALLKAWSNIHAVLFGVRGEEFLYLGEDECEDDAVLGSCVLETSGITTQVRCASVGYDLSLSLGEICSKLKGHKLNRAMREFVLSLTEVPECPVQNIRGSIVGAYLDAFDDGVASNADSDCFYREVTEEDCQNFINNEPMPKLSYEDATANLLQLIGEKHWLTPHIKRMLTAVALLKAGDGCLSLCNENCNQVYPEILIASDPYFIEVGQHFVSEMGWSECAMVSSGYSEGANYELGVFTLAFNAIKYSLDKIIEGETQE